jgi:hypothetical protein
MEFEPPDLSETPISDLCEMLIACGLSNHESDVFFAKCCRDEIARRKPEPTDTQ